jgi:hypothetical protein
MAGDETYPYVTHLNVLHAPLELIDVQALVDACTEDEFFLVIEGLFLIDLEGRTVELGPRQGFTVPRGTVHRTRAPERSIVLMVEAAGVVPTGD